MVKFLMYLMIGSYPSIEFIIVKLVQQIANLSNKYYQVGLYFYKY